MFGLQKILELSAKRASVPKAQLQKHKNKMRTVERVFARPSENVTIVVNNCEAKTKQTKQLKQTETKRREAMFMNEEFLRARRRSPSRWKERY